MKSVEQINDAAEQRRDQNRTVQVDQAKELLNGSIDPNTHPAHKAKAWREIEDYAADRAESQEAVNERDGVPE